MGCVWFIYRNMELCYWLVPGNVKNNWINQLSEKRSWIPLGLRVPIWKINLCSRVLRLSVLPWWRETPETAICWLEGLGRLKCLTTNLDAFWSSFSKSRRCSRNRPPSFLPVSRMYNFCKDCKLCSRWHWLRCGWNDQWSWLIAWVPIFSQHCEWKDMFCIVRECT